tara:strand:+ start:88 stop:510 length:423 start_codon:yes stop_codon:yes gene_type:complete
MIRKAYIFASILLLSSTTALANTGYPKCKRVHLMADGFKTRAAAASWFPETAYIVYSADGKRSASIYGISEKRAKVHRENGISTFKKLGGLTITVRHYDFDRKKNNLRVSITMPGKMPTNPTTYNCGPAQETDYWPKEED